MDRIGNEKLGNQQIVLLVAAATLLTECTIAAVNAEGYAVPATAEEGLLIAGCVQKYADNRLGEAGDETVEVRRGTFVWGQDGTISQADILKPCYAASSTTVSLDPAEKSPAGIILAVDDDGVTVDMMAALTLPTPTEP